MSASLGKGVFLPPIVPYLFLFGKLALKLLYFTRREQEGGEGVFCKSYFTCKSFYTPALFLTKEEFEKAFTGGSSSLCGFFLVKLWSGSPVSPFLF